MKHTILSILILLIASVSFTANAQKSPQGQYSVKGVLVDSLLNEGEPYSTIRISLKKSPAKPVKLAVTDTNGKFSEKLVAPGTYLISFSSIGKHTVQKEFTVSETKKAADLGKVLISEATEMLKGVEVVAQKPLVKAEIDKVTYSIEDDPDSKTNSTLEMLRKVPLVTVDGEDKIQVNGSSNFKVHVNGKPNNMMSNNPTEVLKSLPANSVKSIEVITDPGAKYDAEGVGGILNIVTTGGGMEGYTVTLNGGVSNRGYNASGYGTVQVGKFTVTGNYAYNHNSSPRSYSSSGREDFTSEDYKYLSSEGSSKGNGNFQYGSMEGSFEIDTLNLITFSMNMFGGKFKNDGFSGTSMLNAQRQHAYSYNTVSRSESGWSSIGANFAYQRSFKKKGELLTFSYRYSGSPDNSEAYTDYEDIKDYPYDMDYLRNQYYDNDARTDEHTFQLDYTNPLTTKHKVDMGVKYILRNNKSDSKYFKADDAGKYELDEDLTSKFDQTQDIFAAYADYQLKLGKFGGKAGLRFEHTIMDVEYKYLPERNFDSNFDDLVPSASLTYQLAPTKTIRANYNMRISRPSIWYLNPFRNTSNPTNISYGNPDLESEKSHSLGMTFSSFSQKFNVNLTMNYSFVNNGIERYSFMKDGVQENTYGNIGHTNRTRLSLWMNWNPGSKTRLSVNASGSYADYKSDKEELHVRNHGFQGNFFGNAQQTLPWDLRFSVYGGGGTPGISLQGKGSSYNYYGFSLSRSFLKEKRLTVSVNTSNVFSKYNSYSNNTTTSTFHSWSDNKYPSRYYGCNISWRFGELKAQVKKAARSINNDDLKSGGGGSESSGGGQGGN
ncbi:TonB-dependent receptor domain-containing protein [Phocaeicola sp.]